MPRIKHIAMKVADLDPVGRFLTEFFEFEEVRTRRTRDHVSMHMTDGAIDFTLIQYDSDDSAEARAAGPAPCFHHVGLEVEDLEAGVARLGELGAEIISDSGVVPVKFRVPGGAVMEIVPAGHFTRTRTG